MLVTASVEYLTMVIGEADYFADNGWMSGKMGWRDLRWVLRLRSVEGRGGIVC